MTKITKDSIWDESIDIGLRLAKKAMADQAKQKRKAAIAYRDYLRKSDWISLGDWKPPPKMRFKITKKRGV